VLENPSNTQKKQPSANDPNYERSTSLHCLKNPANVCCPAVLALVAFVVDDAAGLPFSELEAANFFPVAVAGAADASPLLLFFLVFAIFEPATLSLSELVAAAFFVEAVVSTLSFLWSPATLVLVDADDSSPASFFVLVSGAAASFSSVAFDGAASFDFVEVRGRGLGFGFDDSFLGSAASSFVEGSVGLSPSTSDAASGEK
jgi:hypothetical protein